MSTITNHSRRPVRALALAMACIGALVFSPSPAAADEGWGQPDGTGHPSSGQLLRFENGEWFGGCSGTLVSPTVFVTAGHCAIRKQTNPGMDLWVTFDPLWSRIDPPTGRYRVDYAVASPTIDLGVEVLAAPVTHIAPAGFASAGTLDRLLAATTGHPLLEQVGYGQGGSPSEKVPQPWVTSTRRTAPTEVIRVSETRVQTKGNLDHEHPTSGCAGNSGGGLFLPGTQLLTGIMAEGDPMCSTYGLGVRLDSDAARDFLSGYVAVP